MKCLKLWQIYVLSRLFLIIPLNVFPFEISKQKLEHIACSQIRDLYPDITCKGIIFYGKKLELEGNNYLFMVKKSGNSFYLEIVDPKTLKPVRVIPIKISSAFENKKRKENAFFGREVRVIFIKGNIQVETNGKIVEKNPADNSVRIKVGKKYFEGVLQNENTVIVRLY